MVIKLTTLLNESTIERVAMDYLSMMIKKSPFKGKVYVAGGAVRDMVMGLDPKDIDLVVELPQGGIKFAEWLTKKVGAYKRGSNPVIYPTYGTAKFQLYGVTHKGMDLSKLEFEAVMTRSEEYVKGSRKPKVKPGTLKQDVERRDFTVNSLLQDLTTGEILDLTGLGRADIKAGIIKTPLNADTIFADDALRMLRAVRFTVKYGWELPMFMIKAMKRNASMLNSISDERKRDELDKMLVSKNPKQAIRLMQITGLIKYVMPELEVLSGLKQNKYHKWDAMGHTLEVLSKTSPKVITRLAGLMHDIGKAQAQSVIDGDIHFYEHEQISSDIARTIMTRLAYPGTIIKAVTNAISNHMKLKQAGSDGELISDKALRRLKAKLGDHLEDTLNVIHADNISHADAYNLPNQIKGIEKRMKDLDMGSGGKLAKPISGHDIIARYKLDAKRDWEYTKALNAAVEDAVLENPKLTVKQAYAITDKLYKKMK